jgi:hypothetical protein
MGPPLSVFVHIVTAVNLVGSVTSLSLHQIVVTFHTNVAFVISLDVFLASSSMLWVKNALRVLVRSAPFLAL